MDRTAKEVLDLYQNSNVNNQRYMFSLALLGDVQEHSMRDLSRHFQGIRKDDPQRLSHGFRDMQLGEDARSSKGMQQALHDIKRTGKGLDNTFEADDLLTKHFANAATGGMLTAVLGGKALKQLSNRSEVQDTPDVRLKKANSDDSGKASSPSNDEGRKPKTTPGVTSDDNSRSLNNDMNQTNVRRHTEEESEVDSKLAREKKQKRMRAQRQMKRKSPHM